MEMRTPLCKVTGWTRKLGKLLCGKKPHSLELMKKSKKCFTNEHMVMLSAANQSKFFCWHLDRLFSEIDRILAQ